MKIEIELVNSGVYMYLLKWGDNNEHYCFNMDDVAEAINNIFNDISYEIYDVDKLVAENTLTKLDAKEKIRQYMRNNLKSSDVKVFTTSYGGHYWEKDFNFRKVSKNVGVLKSYINEVSCLIGLV